MTRNNLTRNELAEKIYTGTGHQLKVVREVIDKTFALICDALVDGRPVEIRGFATLETRTYKARIGRNPKVPEVPIVIPTKIKVRIKPGRELKERLKHGKT